MARRYNPYTCQYEDAPEPRRQPTQSSSSSGGDAGCVFTVVAAIFVVAAYFYLSRPNGSSSLCLNPPIGVAINSADRKAHVTIDSISNRGNGKSGTMDLELWAMFRGPNSDEPTETKIGTIKVSEKLPEGYSIRNFSSDIPIKKIPQLEQPQTLTLRLRETYRDARLQSTDRVSHSFTIESPYVFTDAQWTRWWERGAVWVRIGAWTVGIMVMLGIVAAIANRQVTAGSDTKPPDEAPNA
jgi:hypothetical protein